MRRNVNSTPRPDPVQELLEGARQWTPEICDQVLNVASKALTPSGVDFFYQQLDQAGYEVHPRNRIYVMDPIGPAVFLRAWIATMQADPKLKLRRTVDVPASSEG